MGWLTGGAAVIIIGGWHAKDPVLEDCVIEDPRGWSGCHLVDGSQGGRIIGNGMLVWAVLTTSAAEALAGFGKIRATRSLTWYDAMNTIPSHWTLRPTSSRWTLG